MICLDELLYSSPAWNKVVDFFKDGEFCEEHYLVAAIRKHLLTEDQKIQLVSNDFSIEDMLNGRVAGHHEHKVCTSIFTQWNEKLGFKKFGYGLL